MDILRNMAIGIDAYRQVQNTHSGAKKRDLSRDAGDDLAYAAHGAASPDSFRSLLQQQLEHRVGRLRPLERGENAQISSQA